MNNQVKTPASRAPFGRGDSFAPSPSQAYKRRERRSVSEYKKSLQEKQTLKRLYGLSERQFKKYVKESLDRMQKVENISDELIKKLEQRLDNVVFRMGVAKSRTHARQLVNHSYFLVNGKPVNIPSFKVGRNDIVAIKDTKKKKGVFIDLTESLKKLKSPNWIEINKDKLEAKIVGEPNIAEVNPPVEISLIFEFYSR